MSEKSEVRKKKVIPWIVSIAFSSLFVVGGVAIVAADVRDFLNLIAGGSMIFAGLFMVSAATIDEVRRNEL